MVNTLTEPCWEELLERLTLYAQSRCLRLFWRGIPGKYGGKPPGGVEPADLAAQAILDLIEGKRIWDQDVEPNLLQFLKGVVDSKVSHLAESLENKMTRRIESYRLDKGTAEEYPVASQEPSPADRFTAEEEVNSFRNRLLELIDDDVLARQVFDCLESGITKPAMMADNLGLEVAEIYNAQKRLRHKVETLIRNYNGISA